MIDRTCASCGRVAPDVDELRLADVAGRQRKLHARIHVAVGRDVAGAVAGAAGNPVEGVLLVRTGRHGGAQKSSTSSTSSESRTTRRNASCADVQVQDGPVAVHHRRDRGIDHEAGADLVGQRLDGGIVLQVLLHQHVGEGHLHALRPSAAGRRRAIARAIPATRVIAIVDFRPMRVDADLHAFDAQRADALRPAPPGSGSALVLILTENISRRACSRMSKRSGRRKISPPLRVRKKTPAAANCVEQILDLGERHLAVIVVIEVAVHAPLVAAVGQVELRAERDAKAQRPGTHFPHQRAHVVMAIASSGFPTLAQ